MNTLRAVQNEVTYRAGFSAPQFQLWGSGAPLLQALYASFAPFGASLASIRSEEVSKSPSDQSIVVQAGKWIYRWRIDRIELTLSNFDAEELQLVPKLLNSNEEWMKAMGASVLYSSRQFSYAGHLTVEGRSAQEVLKSLPHVDLGDIEELRAAGQILHWSDPGKEWQGDLVLDHSQIVPDGFFLLYSGTSTTWQRDYVSLLACLQQRLSDLLARFGLSLEGR